MASITAPSFTSFTSLSSRTLVSDRSKSASVRPKSASLACRATLNITPDPSMDVIGMQRLDEEWLRLGLSSLSAEPNSQSSSPDSEGNVTLQPSGVVINTGDLDEIWLKLGLTPVDGVLGDVTVLPLLASDGATAVVTAAPAVLDEPKVEQAAVAPAVDANSYFATDLRPIVLFDGACNFCSKWTIFLLDNDPLGNLRFASMQSEAGKALLMRAGMKPTDTSEIVLAMHKKSHIGTNAILEIFSRLVLPFPVVAALGMITPAPARNAVYKFVSNNRHRFGPQACRLFDPRFNERFVS